MHQNVLVIGLLLSLTVTEAWIPRFFHGRHLGGFVPPPPRRPEMQGKPFADEMWFEQTLDHFNDADTRTFMQRYFVNTQYYKQGGPVFLSIGGEGPASPVWMENGAWIEYGQNHNALLFMVEHRYYGKTHPTADLSVDNLRYLSSEQALADLAKFIVFAKSKFTIPDNKWIAIGGSYSGALAAWMRLKYPHLIDGAVATSAPVFAQLNFPEYLGVVRDSLDVTSPSCVGNIQQAVQALDQQLTTPQGQEEVKKMFQLCDSINISNTNDIANLYEVLAGNFEDVVQYNKDNRAFEGAVGTNITIDTLCGIMGISSDSPLQRYANVNSLILTTYGQKCQDFLYDKMVASLKKTAWDDNTSAGGRQWTYQTCTEFGFYQTSDYKTQPFGNRFPLNFFIIQCQDIFDPKFNADLISRGINQTNAIYGGYGIKVTNVVFPNGSIDPWHALGIVKDLSPDATAIYIDGTAHCANMYPSLPSDPPELVQARATINKLIGKWVA